MTADIHYRSRLYLSDGLEGKKLDRAKRRLERKPWMGGVYVVSLSRNGQDLLDIYDCKVLAWPYFRKHPPVIVGLALSYGESVGLVEQMVRECWEARGDCALKEYLSC